MVQAGLFGEGRALRALTLWRPWTASIVHGPKRVENRPWAPPAAMMGERFLIHAGRTWDSKGERFIQDRWPDFSTLRPEHHTEGIVGVARLVGAIESRDGQSPQVRMFAPGWEERARAWCESIDRGEELWFFGPFGWLLDEVRALRDPVNVKGKQGLWIPTAETMAAVASQIGGVA